MCASLHTFVHVCVRLHWWLCVYACMCVYTYLCGLARAVVWFSVRLSVWLSVRICVRMCVCEREFVRVHVCTRV
jgi:hypothetical protein